MSTRQTVHTRFHLSFLSRMSTWHAAHTRVSIFLSGLVCRHCEQSKLTFPSFFPGQVDHVASNPTTRFHSFSSFACQHRDQRERAFLLFNAFPFFVSGPLVDATNSTHKRFHLSVLRRMSTWHAAHTRVSMFFLFRLSVWRTVQTHVSIFLSSAASPPGTDNHSAHALSLFFIVSPVDATLLVILSKE